LAGSGALTGMLKGNTASAPSAVTSTAAYVTYWSDANTIAGEQYLATSRGGLGASVTAAGAGELLYSSATTTYGHLAAGSSGQIIKSGGAGAPTWNTAAALTKSDDTNVTLALGGSPTTALVNAASITVGWTGQLAIARGGTNSTATPTAGGVAYGTGTAYAFNSAGTSGQFLISGGAGAPTWTSTVPATSLKWNALTNPDGNLSLNMGSYTTQFSWTGGGKFAFDTNGNVGIGTTGPQSKLTINTPTFTGAYGSYADARASLLISGSNPYHSIQLSSTYNNVTYPNYGLVLVNGSSTTDFDVWGIMHDGPAKAAGGLQFAYLHGTGSGANIHGTTPMVTFQKSGNVGIGTTTPGYKLDVTGDVRLSGNLIASANTLADCAWTAYTCDASQTCTSPKVVTGVERYTTGALCGTSPTQWYQMRLYCCNL